MSCEVFPLEIVRALPLPAGMKVCSKQEHTQTTPNSHFSKTLESFANRKNKDIKKWKKNGKRGGWVSSANAGQLSTITQPFRAASQIQIGAVGCMAQRQIRMTARKRQTTPIRRGVAPNCVGIAICKLRCLKPDRRFRYSEKRLR